jgi:hypothetical protein
VPVLLVAVAIQSMLVGWLSMRLIHVQEEFAMRLSLLEDATIQRLGDR